MWLYFCLFASMFFFCFCFLCVCVFFLFCIFVLFVCCFYRFLFCFTFVLPFFGPTRTGALVSGAIKCYTLPYSGFELIQRPFPGISDICRAASDIILMSLLHFRNKIQTCLVQMSSRETNLTQLRVTHGNQRSIIHCMSSLNLTDMRIKDLLSVVVSLIVSRRFISYRV